MPETPFDQTLERILAYPEGPDGAEDDGFVVDVMAGVRRERGRRRAILAAFGGVGALFGLAGAILLADPVDALFTELLSGTHIMQAALLVSGAAAFYVWMMGDDLSLER